MSRNPADPARRRTLPIRADAVPIVESSPALRPPAGAASSSPATVDAAGAATDLGVSLPTLYAYVSRGLVRSLAEPGTRRRRYLVEDVWALKRRRDERRDPARIAEEALHWGPPVLESSISVIRDGRLYYRGRDVATLATSCRLEEVAS